MRRSLRSASTVSKLAHLRGVPCFSSERKWRCMRVYCGTLARNRSANDLVPMVSPHHFKSSSDATREEFPRARLKYGQYNPTSHTSQSFWISHRFHAGLDVTCHSIVYLLNSGRARTWPNAQADHPQRPSRTSQAGIGYGAYLHISSRERLAQRWL